MVKFNKIRDQRLLLFFLLLTFFIKSASTKPKNPNPNMVMVQRYRFTPPTIAMIPKTIMTVPETK